MPVFDYRVMFEDCVLKYNEQMARAETAETKVKELEYELARSDALLRVYSEASVYDTKGFIDKKMREVLYG